ncbi:LuxR C-terminal-related transcriptional regulator [Streptomyces sp. NPDC087422]|uniref:response regulator transcription factor n=1 Tax=Streptomyces sp. NPDC087422 TaxID=3365786 RepID=UPI0038061960
MGLSVLLSRETDLEVVGEVADIRHALPCVARLSPHVVIIDALDVAPDVPHAIQQLVVGGADGCPKILALVQSLEQCAQHWQAAGARGVLDSQASPERIIAAVRMVAAGYRLVIPTVGAATAAATAAAITPEPPQAETSETDLVSSGITRRERDVLQLIIRGYSNAEISEALFLSESTVKSHVQRMLDKLALRNRVHAVIYAYEKGIVRAGGNLESLVGTSM